MNSAERGSGYRHTPAVGQEKARSTQPVTTCCASSSALQNLQRAKRHFFPSESVTHSESEREAGRGVCNIRWIIVDRVVLATRKVDGAWAKQRLEGRYLALAYSSCQYQ